MAAPGRLGRAVHYCIWAWLALQLFYGQALAPSEINIGINITPDRLALLLIAALFAARVMAGTKSLLPGTATEAMMLCLAALAFVSLSLSGADAKAGGAPNRWLSSIFNLLAAPYAAYYVAKNLPCSEATLRRYLGLFCALGLYLGLTAVFETCGPQALVFPRWIMDPGLGNHFGRARGPVLNADVLGQLLVFCFLATLLYLQKAGRMAKAACLLAATVMLSGVYFTYTRGPWLALLCGLLVLLFSRSLRRYALITCALIVAAALLGATAKLSLNRPTLFSERATTVYDRVNIMAATARVIADHPLLGVGYGRLDDEYPKYWARLEGIPLVGKGETNHNVPLGLMAELGVFGAALYLGIYYRLIRSSAALCGRGALLEGLALTHLAWVFSYLVNMQTYDVRWSMLQNVVVFLFSGLVAARAAGAGSAAGASAAVSVRQRGHGRAG
jgi:O-antigen ligase